MRRVVVTGLGLVSPVGNDVETSWRAVLSGDCGLGPITRFDATDFACRIAGEVKGFDAAQHMPAKDARRFAPFIGYAVAASREALTDAGLVTVTDETQTANVDVERCGVLIGSGAGGLAMQCENYKTFLERGPRRISPFLISGSVINMAGSEVSILFGLKGPNFALSSACATGLHAIGEAGWIIARDDADIMLAGGTESLICEDSIGCFGNIHALSSRNDDPKHASRPFDRDRDGFVMAEGCGVLILEEYEHAVKRGAHIYCELAGYGLSADAWNMTAPSTEGPVRAMQMALKRAAMKPHDIDMLNAHGTSTPIGDTNECAAIETVFGDHAKNLSVTSTKGNTGHALAAAGAMESVFTVLSIRDQVVPATLNLENLDPSIHVKVVRGEPEHRTIRAAMKNNFGFGGTNATLVFKTL